MDRAPSPYVERLNRKQRLRLFRNYEEDGLFAASWIAVEAKQNHRLAKALQQATLPNVNLALIERLEALGEHQASDHPTRIVSLYGTPSERSRLLANNLALEELRPYILYHRETPEKQADGLAALREILGDEQAELNPENPDTLDMARLLALGLPFTSLDKANRWRSAVEQWILSANATRPIADFCRAECPQEAGSCVVTMMALTGGYYEVIRLDSPLENVIPQNVFLKSKRARRMALRRAALNRAETNEELASVEEIAGYSRCLAEHIGTERALD